MKDLRYCITCGLQDPSQRVCRLTGRAIADPQKEYCSNHVREIHQCEWCGSVVLKPTIYSIDDEYHAICGKCSEMSGLCPTCEHGKYCDFEENPIGISKQTQQQIRQGNQIMITTVVNPERIRETCAKNCKCFSEEFGCLRQINQSCGEWSFRFRKGGK